MRARSGLLALVVQLGTRGIGMHNKLRLRSGLLASAALAAGAVLLTGAACSSSNSANAGDASASTVPVEQLTIPVELPTIPAEQPTIPAKQPTILSYEVVAVHPHDENAFTQGLEYHDGTLYETTGLRGESVLRAIDFSDLSSGEHSHNGHSHSHSYNDSVRAEVRANPAHFGEGLTRAGDQLIWLTWQAGVATSHDIDTLAVEGQFSYEGEGWGLCYDENADQLVMSNGSSTLTFRHPETFEVTSSVEVTSNVEVASNVEVGSAEGGRPGRFGTQAAEPVDLLNELECVDGLVWANVWQSDLVLVLDPANGEVVAVADLSGLAEQARLASSHPARDDSEAVLNGIAYRADTDTFLVTGKRWTKIYELRFSAGRS